MPYDQAYAMLYDQTDAMPYDRLMSGLMQWLIPCLMPGQPLSHKSVSAMRLLSQQHPYELHNA